MSKKDCIATARQSLNLFSEDELERYVKKVADRTNELRTQGNPFARQAAIKEVNQESLESLLNDSASSARNVEKYEVIKQKMDKDVEPIAFMEKRAKNTDYNIETASNAVRQLLHNESFGEFSKEELSALEDGKLDKDIYSVANGNTHHDPLVKRLGESLRKYIDYRNSKLILSDAMAPEDMSQDRFFRNTYDPSAMLKLGRENWIELHKSRINIKETFKHSRAANKEGEIDGKIVDEMIGNTFDNIIEGNGALFTRASVSRDADIIKRSRHMFYKYKDWENWGLSNTEYGQGTLFKAWLKDIQASGGQAGMAEIMGTNPQQMYLKMRHLQTEKTANTLKTSFKHSEADALFKNLLGATKGAFNPDLANIGASIRNVTSAARSGFLALLSMSDTANVAGLAQRAGFGYWKPLLNGITHLFDLLPSESRAELAKIMSSSVTVHSGTVNRFSDLSGMGDTVSRLTNKFFHVIGLTALDRGNKLSAMEPIMKGFGRQSNKSFNSLKEQQQAYLRRFNISEAEWDGLRSKTQKRWFTTDNVNNLSDAEIKSLWNDSDKSVPLSMYRSTLYRKVFAMFDTAQEFSVLNSTAYINMVTTGNFKAGHIGGEIWRGIAQFKGYPLQYFRRVWVGGFQDFDSWQARGMFALNQALGTVMLAGLSESLISLAKGYTPPDPSKMSNGERIKYFGKLLSGGLGTYGAITNDHTTGKTFAGAFFGSPSFKFVTDPLVTAIALAKGDLQGAKQAAREFANVANPMATIPLSEPFLDAFLGNKPYLEPGQRPLF